MEMATLLPTADEGTAADSTGKSVMLDFTEGKISAKFPITLVT